MEQNPIINQLSEHSGLTPEQVRAFIRSLNDLVKTSEAIPDATMANEVERFWDLIANAILKNKLVQGKDIRIDEKVVGFFWKPIYAIYAADHPKAYGRAGNTPYFMLEALKCSKAYLETKQSWWIGQRKSSAVLFRRELIGVGVKSKDGRTIL